MLREILRNYFQGRCMKQFLLIQLARFGDLVQTGRLIQSLENQGQVHLCIDTSLKDLAVCLYPNTIVHTVPAHASLQMQSSQQMDNIRSVHATMSTLKSIDFSAVYNINYSPLNASIVRLFAPEMVYGYAVHHGQLLRSPWVQKAFRWVQNRIISPINLVDFWAYFTKTPQPAHLVNPPAHGQGQGIGVVLAGRESRRSLPPPVLAQVVRTFFESSEGKPQVYLLGSKGELPLAKQLQRLLPVTMQSHITDYCGKTTWTDLMDAVQGLDALITPDTGTMHLGARLGVPIHAFFLSSAWCHETGPYGQGHYVWQSNYTCAPCLESAPCLINTACLQDYNHPNFFRTLTAHVQNRPLPDAEGKKLPATLTCQSSYLDALGSTWKTLHGDDPHAEKRHALRAVLAEYCHSPLENAGDASMAQYFYEEADAMLREQKTMQLHGKIDAL